MELDLFKKIVGDVKSGGHRLMWLHHMGEPLVYPFLAEAIEYTKRELPSVPCISTNGMLLNTDRLKELREAGANTIMICLSSMRKDVYEKLRVGAIFEVVIDNIHEALDMNCFNIILQRMDTIYNHDETADAYYKEFGEARPGFRVSESWPVNRFKPGGFYIGYNEPAQPKCHLIATHFVICQDGRVPVCCFDYDCTVLCGDVSKDSIDVIAENGWDDVYDLITKRELDMLPACKDCLSMDWRNGLAPGRLK
jgi:hypothetical protein